MTEIDVLEAEKNFDALLARVEAGEEIVITRDGVAVAKLVPAQAPFDREVARAAVEDIVKHRAMIDAPPLGWEEIKKMRDEGRR